MTKEEKYEYNSKWRMENQDKVKESRRKWKRENPDKVKEYNLRDKRRNTSTNMTWLLGYLGLERLTCSRCGYNEFESAIEGHHLNRKVKEYLGDTFGRWKQSAKLEVFIKKLVESKTIFSCANCHRGLHRGEWDNPNKYYDSRLDDAEKEYVSHYIKIAPKEREFILAVLDMVSLREKRQIRSEMDMSCESSRNLFMRIRKKLKIMNDSVPLM